MKIYVIIIATLLLKPLDAQMYTLETCETDIATDVPQFFQDYFQCVTARMSTIGDDGRQYVNLYYNSKPPYQTWYYDEQYATSSNDPNWIQFNATNTIDAMTPGVITELDLVISIPVNPGSDLNPARDLTINGGLVDGEVGTSNYEYPMGVIGSALNGVTMYNPCAAPGDLIENEASTFDLYSGHPTGPAMGNTYHYHTNSPGPLEVLAHKGLVTNTTLGSAEIEVFGINCDGVVVLGCTELNGSAVDPTEWDAQNGHVHDMVGADGTVYFEQRYHTHICYTDITDEDTDGVSPNDNLGYDQHEFTPEISYYETPGYAGLGNNTSYDRCLALSEPVLPDNGWVALDDDMMIPGEFALYNNYPNPFNPTTVLDYDIPENSFVNITVYDMMGRRVKTLVNANQSAGFKSVVWDATNIVGQPVAAGVYIYTIVAGDFRQTKKMAFIK
jgi:hypothetical protein